MPFIREATPLPDCFIVRQQVYPDGRGFFTEVWRSDFFAELGLPANFVQLNHSGSVGGVVRGLHFQWDPPMGKLMRVAVGRAMLVAVDIRKGSPTLGQAFTLECDASDRVQLWAPPGFARGFCVLSDFAEINYLVTNCYNPKGESGILWNDPALGIHWPVSDPILSKKDATAQTLAQWLDNPLSDHFTYP
ncbi:MAG: dTDP-4-dehydrorhamnose 3,5-epimerase [Magnetococcales bacterium]|nr:dTDP-4-dehydrorhamnose 3,5-epimerase [Magnetococcales bacterium]